MANIKSAKKRVLIAQRNTERNVAFKTSIKTAVKKVLACAVSEDRTELKYELKDLLAFLNCLNPSKVTKCIFGRNVLK